MKLLANIIGAILAVVFFVWATGPGQGMLQALAILFIFVGLLMAIVRVACWGVFGSK